LALTLRGIEGMAFLSCVNKPLSPSVVLHK